MDKNCIEALFEINPIENGVGKPVVIFGAGDYGKKILDLFIKSNVDVVAVCDNDKEKIGKEILGYVIEDYEVILNTQKDFRVVIASLRHFDEMKKDVLTKKKDIEVWDIGFSSWINREFIMNHKEDILLINSWLNDLESKRVYCSVLRGAMTGEVRHYETVRTDDEYFNNLINFEENEVFLDGGAFTGDTIKLFRQKVKSYEKIIGFEPSETIYRDLAEYVQSMNDKRIKVEKKGLYSFNGKIGFNSTFGNGGDKIDHYCDTVNSIEVCCIDNYIDNRISFIKLDVEGSELEALKGAVGVLRRYKPKLAICLYHKIQDFVDIPSFLHELGLGYQFYVRHHGNYPAIDQGTVLYAVAK